MKHLLRAAILLAALLLCPAAWGQTLPFEVTTADDITNHTEKFYWIESVGGKGFHIVPNSNNTYASTTNAPTMRALWYFMESGESGYYYIINKETGTYLKRSGNAGADNSIGVANYVAADDSKFKFSFDTPQDITQGSWVIYPKDTGTSGWVGKKSGNLEFGKWLKVSNWGNTPVGDLNSQWIFVARNDVQWPKSGLPFVVSTNSDKHYYNINHVRSSTYNVSYDGDNYVTISTADDKKKVWYFKEAEADPNIDNLKYYYIVNAQTEKYLKFTATTINGSNQNDKFILSDYVAGDKDRFQFVVVNSYDNQGNSYYSIMPKLAMSKYDVSNYANSMAPANAANDEKLDLRSDRNTDKGHWVFVETTYVAVEAPTITNNFDGTISLSTTTDGATIYYTTNGDTPDNTSTPYSSAFSLGDATVIKAIAYLGAAFSAVTTYDVPQCDTPTISFNNSTSQVTINYGSGGTVYYTTDGGIPTTSSTAYSAPFSVTSNTVVKAIATNAGYLASETATQTIITEPSFQNKTGFSYVYDGTEKEPIDHLEYSSTTIPSTAYLLNYTNHQNVGTATVTITDSGADDGFIVYGSTTFTITAAPLSITAEAKSKGYRDADPELTYTYSGLVGGESIDGNLTGALAREAGDNVGTYAIGQGTLTCPSGNYTINFSGATFTITAKSLGSGITPATGITIDDITKTNDTYSVPGINHNSTPLTVGTEGTAYDYSLTTDDSNPKYHIVTFTGANNYTGSVSAKFVNVDFHANSAETEWTSSFVIGSSEGAFATPTTGYSAYIVTGASGNAVTTQSLSYIPEGVPVILLADASSNGFMAQPTSGDAPDVTGNKLAVSTGASFAAGQIYILYNGEFVLNAAGTLAAGKVYLPKSAISSGSSPSPSRLTINWGEPSGIDDNSQFIIHHSQLNEVWYSVDGRRLSGRPTKKGLYLMNGQKVIVR